MPLMQCDNCDFVAEESNMNEAQDLSMRLDVGGIYTDKECPHCGTLAYLVDEDSEQDILDEVVDSLMSGVSSRVNNQGKESALEFIDTMYSTNKSEGMPAFKGSMSQYLNREDMLKARADFYEALAGRYFESLKQFQ